MTDFSTSADLNVTVTDSSLKRARSDVESAIADTPVTVEADVGNRPGSAMGSISNSGGLRTDALEKQSSTLGEISSSWEENLQLNERRNELLDELVDMAKSGDFDGDSSRMSLPGMGMGMGGIVISALTGYVVGSELMSFLRGFSFPKINIPDIDVPDSIPNLGVPEGVPDLGVPSNLPNLGVPNSIPNLGIPESVPDLGIPDSIPNLGIPKDIPDLGIPKDIPDLGVPTDIPNLGIPSDIPNLGIETPSFPIPIPVASPGSSGGNSGTGSSSPGALDKIITAASIPAAQTVNAAEGAANWAGENTGTAIGVGSLVAGVGLAAADGPLPFGDAAGAAVAGAGGGTAILSSLLDGGSGTASATTADESSNTTASASSTSSSSNRRPNRARESSRQKPEINYSPTINADFSDLKRKIDRDIRELERRVSRVEKDLDRVTR